MSLTVYGDVPARCDGHLAGDDFAGMVDSVRFAQTDVKLADFIHRADRSDSIGFAYRLPAAFLALSRINRSSSLQFVLCLVTHTNTVPHLISRVDCEVSVSFVTFYFFVFLSVQIIFVTSL